MFSSSQCALGNSNCQGHFKNNKNNLPDSPPHLAGQIAVAKLKE